MLPRYLLAFALGITACQKEESGDANMSASPSVAMEQAMPASPPSAAYAPAPKAARGRSMDAASEMAADMATGGGLGGASSEGMQGKKGSAQAEPLRTQAAARMVQYTAALKLKVVNGTETLEKAANLNDSMGGYVESLVDSTLVLRVPVARFRELFAALLNLGEVIERSINAEDVTDAFAAMDLRAGILRASRDRLVTLLGRATTARQKLELLSEIDRLTQAIDQLEAAMTATASLAAYSRITLEAVARTLQLDSSANEKIAVFRWIHALSPFDKSTAIGASRLKLDAPEGMLAIERDDDLWLAESADGAAIWASERDNEPRGSTEFWVEALRARLGPQYVESEVTDVGGFKVLRLIDEKNDTAYRYLVALRARGKKLQVVEVYFSSLAQEKRYAAAVQAVMQKG